MHVDNIRGSIGKFFISLGNSLRKMSDAQDKEKFLEKFKNPDENGSLSDPGDGSSSNTAQDTLPADAQIVEHLLEFRDLKASEVMIPRTDVFGVPISISMPELLEQFIKTKLTRIPIYKTSLDDMVGFIHVKDILPHIDQRDTFDMHRIIRQFIYVPRFTKCIDLLGRMRINATPLAVVLDEYGGTEGIVTVARLTEGIVGEITDEHDTARVKVDYVKKIGNNSYIVDARTSIQDVEKELGKQDLFSDEDGEYETFGGFILSYLGRIPSKDEKFLHNSTNLSIEVLDATPRKIKLLKITLINDA